LDADSQLLTLRRGRPPQGSGEHGHVVDDHHVIHALRRKSARRDCLLDNASLVLSRPTSPPLYPVKNFNPHRSTLRLALKPHAYLRARIPQGGHRRSRTETLAPGAKVSEVARRHGISASLVFSWRRQSRASQGTMPMPRFAAVQVADTPTNAVTPTTSEQARAGSGRSGIIEISLGGGRRVRVDASVDAAALARVLDVLERR
jgi:transposase